MIWWGSAGSRGPHSGLGVGHEVGCPVRLPNILAGAALMIAIAACGGSSPATAVPTTTPGPAGTTPGATTAAATTAPVATTAPPVVGTLDVCSLLTPADLKTATGKDYLAGTSLFDGQCSWDTDPSGFATSDAITAYVAPSGPGLPSIKANTPAGGVDLTVAGHDAYYNLTQTGGAPSLWVDLGDGRMFTLQFTARASLATSQPIATQLAEVAVPRIQ